jgi:arginase
LKRLDDKKAKGFWIHVDLDVLNDEIMPAVDSRQPDGLQYHELRQLIRLLLQSGKAIGIQFTIYNPDLDKDKRIGKKLVEEMVTMFSF